MSEMSYRNRIDSISKNKYSKLILALDPGFNTTDLIKYAQKLIFNLSDYLCAIKLNFHIILPLSFSELKQITSFAHKQNLQVIADIKLNDIPNTNKITIEYLNSMGFDAVIVNPFIGLRNLKSTIDFAHSINFGVISLVYMSHEGADEGYGSQIVLPSNNSDNPVMDKIDKTESLPFYRIFYQNSIHSNADGIVIGGNRYDILNEISADDKIIKPKIYSPGLITQGGDPKTALKSGSDFLIIGRAILNSYNPIDTLNSLKDMMKDNF